MAKWDKEYLKLCKKILKEGKEVENRTGINSIKIPSYHFHFDLREEFPILTTKQLFFKNAIRFATYCSRNCLSLSSFSFSSLFFNSIFLFSSKEFKY